MPLQLVDTAKWFLVSLCSLLLASCDIPRDPQLTTQLVKETETIRLGWIKDAEATTFTTGALAKIQQETGARLEITRADSEAIFDDLAGGRLDLAYGKLSMDNPWSKEVYFGHALGWRASAPPHEPANRFVMRNGENGWIMLVEGASRP